MRWILLMAAALPTLVGFALAQEPDDPELIFKKTTVWRMLSPDAKLATYALDDPLVEGIACHFTIPEIGGWAGWAGFAEERSETSLACRQVGPITFKGKFEQGEEVYRQRRSLFFKKMQIVRGCDAKRNVLVYLSYTDKLIEGSPQNSTSTVPLTPWGTIPAPKCADFLEQ
jgi:CreA protein